MTDQRTITPRSHVALIVCEVIAVFGLLLPGMIVGLTTQYSKIGYECGSVFGHTMNKFICGPTMSSAATWTWVLIVAAVLVAGLGWALDNRQRQIVAMEHSQ